MNALLAVVLLLSPMIALFIVGAVLDRLSDDSTARFERFIRTEWSYQHPQEDF